jgi:GntR family transcriptional regulator, rspAB operon transcriptional repressor
MTAMVARGRLTDLAYQHLREGILRGELPIGSVLDESDLARTLGTSRTPVRQALGRLLQEGLIEIGSHRQATVRGFSADHRAEILLLREALEGLAVARACELMEVDQIDRLRLLLIQQRRSAKNADNEEFIELDEQFHLKIAEGAQLPILHAFLGQLRGFVRVARLGSARPPSVLATVVAEHERIVDALERRDASAAVEALTNHLHTSDYAIAPPKRGRRAAELAQRSPG